MASQSTAPKPASAPPRTPEPRAEFYTVKSGDTLYSIALEHGLDYRDLAQWNGIDSPSSLKVGQQLHVMPQPGAVVTAPLKTPAGAVEAKPLGTGPSATPLPAPVAAGPGSIVTDPKAVRVPYSEQALAQLMKPEAQPPMRADSPRPETRPEVKPDNSADSARVTDEINWGWPVKGKVLSTFNGTTSKGVDIGGKRGQAVLASAPGRVIFSGTGVRGMGKFVVIKHTETFISVYAHNDALFVKYGQNVTRGQKIAEMGDSDADQIKLHFEIRRLGNPVDPLKLLPDEPLS